MERSSQESRYVNAGLKRCGKSCRLRWLNYLNPKITRGNITPEEEELIITMHKLVGNRWSLIAGGLPRRTDNEIKNFWNTILCRKVHGEQVVRKRKPSKRTKGNKSNSNSAQLQNSNSVPAPNVTDFPALISAESTAAVLTTQQSVTPEQSTTEFMCERMNPEACPSHVYGECHNPEPLVPSQENNTAFMGNIMQNIAYLEAPHCDVYEECYDPQQIVPSLEKITESMEDLMKNITNTEAPQCDVYQEFYTPQQLGQWHEDYMEFMGEMMHNTVHIEDPQSGVYGKSYTQEQSSSSEGDRTELVADIMQHIGNSESHESDVYGECYTQQQSDSSEGYSTKFQGRIMQNNDKIESHESHDFQKSYHDLMTGIVREEICMLPMNGYSMQSSQDILSELTFTSDESIFEHWMAKDYPEQNNTFDLGSLATLFEL